MSPPSAPGALARPCPLPAWGHVGAGAGCHTGGPRPLSFSASSCPGAASAVPAEPPVPVQPDFQTRAARPLGVKTAFFNL